MAFSTHLLPPVCFLQVKEALAEIENEPMDVDEGARISAMQAARRLWLAAADGDAGRISLKRRVALRPCACFKLPSAVTGPDGN